MTRSIRSLSALLAVSVAGFMAVAATNTYRITRDACAAIYFVVSDAWRFAVDVFVSALRAIGVPAPRMALPGLAVQLLQARQYLLRQIKRARPTMTPGWRLAPST